jgi:hypothetical protein
MIYSIRLVFHTHRQGLSPLTELGEEIETITSEIQIWKDQWNQSINEMQKKRESYMLGVEFEMLATEWVETKRKLQVLEADIHRLQII